MRIIAEEKAGIKIFKATSPVPTRMAWQIESFLFKILEYGDYSFKKALAGKLDSGLQCTFFIAQNNGSILAVAGALYFMDNPAVAIMGPVCTDPMHRKKGLACQLCGMLLEHLKLQQTQAVYLGVRDNIPAVNLYRKLGFTNYSGIVMRRLFVSESEFLKRYLSGQKTIIRKLYWRDFAEVSALICEPAGMYSFDFSRQIFSSRYVETQRFLNVFPDTMNWLEKHGGCGAILLTREHSSIVGIAFIKSSLAKTQNHITFLEFFVHDGFEDRAKELVGATIKQFSLDGKQMILCHCLSCNTQKKQILLSLGAKPYAALPDFIRINDKFQDTIIYKLMR